MYIVLRSDYLPNVYSLDQYYTKVLRNNLPKIKDKF